MPRIVFVDSSAFIARFLDDDQYHEQAMAETARLVKSGRYFVTSNYVFDEVITRVQARADHGRARSAGDRLRTDPRLMRVLIDEAMEDEAWRLHAKLSDQPLSFTDVTSVAVMRSRSIREIFSFDSDFDRVGLVRLPAGR